MAWRVAIVLDQRHNTRQLSSLVHQTPVWAVETLERKSAASSIRQGTGELWAPEAAFTLFTPGGAWDTEEICRNILGTVQEHHPRLAAVDLIGIQASPKLNDMMREADFEPAGITLHEGIRFRKPITKLEDVRELILDGLNWHNPDDVYNSFFEAVGAPVWHGRNFDALRDGIVTGHVNRVEVPYRIRIKNYSRIGGAARVTTERFVDLIRGFQREGCPVTVETKGIVDPIRMG